MTLPKFERVYHPCECWEEIQHNMWGTVEDRAKYLSMAIAFTGNHYLYGHFMKKVIEEWPISCENAFTDNNLNRKAWLGHAACALAFECPEDIVRQAWSKLNYEQQLLANQQAERYILIWADRYSKSKGLRNDMEETLL
jgi:hypothetical protein